MSQLDDSRRIAIAIKFKEYLLTRDVQSRRIIIDHFIEKLSLPIPILNWFYNLRGINDQIDAKDRKDQIKVDAFWNTMINDHSKDSIFRIHMQMFIDI